MKVISIIGKKKSGKTTLIEDLIMRLRDYGSVGCIKHAQELDLDESKDTTRLFNAGAEVVIGSSEHATLKISKSKNKSLNQNLKEQLKDMADYGMDFVLVEGFKSSDLPKIVLNPLPDRDGDEDGSDGEIANVVMRLSGNPKRYLQDIVELVLKIEDYEV
ncbi:MAG: molybdopterin-guanine dinucleotide biosynthesis protein B [Methanophagales archaeon]|nr:molybdopterin-guanine dinucleotide biosynthesis protein B [Methanophagales archaeon]